MNADLQAAPAAPPARKPGAAWTVAELLEVLPVSERTIYRMMDAGQISTFKFGFRRLIADAEVQRILAGK